MNDVYYEHYFRGETKEFSPDLIKPIKNIPYFCKPLGGFWASRIDAVYGWRQWCDGEDEPWAEGTPFIFSLKEDTKVLHIRSVADIPDHYIDPNTPCSIIRTVILDFEKLAKEYDAIEIDAGRDSQLYYAFYGWDCDSILIFNPEIIVIPEEVK